MRTRPQLRRIARWTAVAATASLAILWLLSVPTFDRQRLFVERIGTTHSFTLAPGTLLWQHFADPQDDPTGWSASWIPTSFSRLDPLAYGLFLPARFPRGTTRVVIMPLWLIVALSGGIAAWLWTRDRRFTTRIHCLKCGADLAANDGKSCAQCGLDNPPTVRRKRMRREWLSRDHAARIAALSFIVAVFTIPRPLINLIAFIDGNPDPRPDAPILGLPRTYGLYALLAINVILAYVLARYVFTFLRWRYKEMPEAACLACGYDLTGNQSGKCPECGTPTSTSAGTSPNGANVGSRGAEAPGTQAEPTNQP